VDKVGKIDGKPVAGISLDQRAAELVGDKSLLPSLRFGYSGGETSYFFDRSGRSLPVERDPRLAFESMFKGRQLVAPNWPRRLGQATAAAADAPRVQTYDRQVVDLILEDAKSLHGKLGRSRSGQAQGIPRFDRQHRTPRATIAGADHPGSG
jgi:hypothetical protein